MYVVYGGGYTANFGWEYRANLVASVERKTWARCLFHNGFDGAFAVLVDSHVYFAANPTVCVVTEGLQ